MIYKIKRWLKKEYIKYILGQCKHICFLCEFKDECIPHFVDEYEYWKGK